MMQPCFQYDISDQESDNVEIHVFFDNERVCQR